MKRRMVALIAVFALALAAAGCGESRTPEMQQAQRELDAACSQIDVEGLQNEGVNPREFGCEPDGSGIPVEEWIAMNE